jgi:hypothetical protein
VAWFDTRSVRNDPGHFDLRIDQGEHAQCHIHARDESGLSGHERTHDDGVVRDDTLRR